MSDESIINQYKLARQMQRKHYFYLGPTNSGKTHAAFEALLNANSGVYLAPLRLLAMEIRDRLVENGIPCNLITGEERVIIPDAQHTASTIEMLNRNKPVDVAIIDEIQMLQDVDRGSAWTAAITGVPANQVYLCGSTAVTESCTRLLTYLNEPFTITYLARKTPLVLQEDSLCGQIYATKKLLNKLQTGDALIAFNRKDILTYASQLRQWGFKVATIYGALSPEVRRKESSRFLNGEAQILIATDAIGMGLNLPIRRIIFCHTRKFDGVATRLLNTTEVKQIAGRAGRFGLYETGYVNVLENDEFYHVQHMLNADDTAKLDTLPIALDFNIIDQATDQLFTKKLSEVLEHLLEHTTRQTQLNKASIFHPANISTQLELAYLIDMHAPDMSMQDKYIFACAPTSLNVNIEKDYYIQCLNIVSNHQTRHLPSRPNWLDSQQADFLEAAELLSQQISLYAWLSYKFRKVFIDSPEEIQALRKQVNRYILQAIQKHKGYGKTSRALEQQFPSY